jgi:hypothetical protein
MKPDILAEGLALHVAEPKPKKIIKAIVEEETPINIYKKSQVTSAFSLPQK